ncbi:hypothetical protein CTAYLR_008833 [Chrysophaeum taylorii]|uniref:RNA helicase n=1 Tax=Chrysophaeum taylorii TaxID=2483200 RepID=A0AAD7UA66_9STRA|nr:hypothetical protein CTAYLR_008833 [Chrysophaeum taylorii]
MRRESSSSDSAAEEASALAAVISARLKSKPEEEVKARRERALRFQATRREEAPVAAGAEWTLDDENDQDEDELLVLPRKQEVASGGRVTSLREHVERLKKRQRVEVSAENDPLDEFLELFEEEEEEEEERSAAREERKPAPPPKSQHVVRERLFNSDGDVMDESERRQAEQSALEAFAEHLRKKELRPIDHSTVEYLKVRKNLYVVPRQLAALTAEEIEESRSADEIKVRGASCPPPVSAWSECGLPRQADEIVRRFEEPFPIQKQAIPALMSGRDVIGIAKTGSGKTLAFVLPAVRHVADQPPVVDGSEGPIALIMAPARELAVQIYKEARRFAQALNLRATAVYGGARVAEQIADLKRGAEIVVCTPGRMIDLLTMQQGRMLGLSRVSFVVLDEADRLFDMGFEPQIATILRNVRPDRQTALFSATFPRAVEQLARKILQYPIEIVCGSRSVASEHIVQYVEVREEATKFVRLLQLLGVWFDRGSTLVFVDTQAKCDSIFRDLLKAGYACLSLHGGHAQTDRDSTIADFKNNAATVLVATSVAGRGLDVPAIRCVVNYSAPNHLEDYVHRVGRTGRAGRPGTAYTFVDPVNEESFAPILAKALSRAKQQVPPELTDLVTKFKQKAQTGEAKWAASGFRGNRGFKFDEDELTEQKKREKIQKEQFFDDLGLLNKPQEEEEEEEEEEKTAPGPPPPPEKSETAATTVLPEGAKLALAALSRGVANTKNLTPVERAKILAATFGKTQPKAGATALERARALAASTGGSNHQTHFSDELDINDFPPEARLRATHRENILRIGEETGAALISRGVFVPQGKVPPPGEKRLHLVIEANDEIAVKAAKAEMLRLLNDETRNAALGLSRRAASNFAFGKYSLI